ncbi:MAG: hypothetical protein LBB67_02190 [Oscillospiraceae bacterium]|jgi:hypothetical protein|nr:hypothetical protein [Oscillospiraceae bacterium]
MNNEAFEKARTFIYRNARPLDIVRFQYHFENGSKEAVLTALAAYQNEDGGFGYALEPDSWNPNSSPIQTRTATEILREIGFTDSAHPIIQGILRFLGSGQYFNGKFWSFAIKSNEDYPHAPWWGFNDADDNGGCNDYNPTTCLVGFTLRYAEKNSELFQTAARVANKAIKHFLDHDGFLNDGHCTLCYVRLMHYCEAAALDSIDISAFKEKLYGNIKYLVTYTPPEKWDVNSYNDQPSFFLNSPDAVYSPEYKQLAELECDWIIKTQLPDGSWPIPWGWNDYPEEWAISKNWWKGNGALLNLLYLKGMGVL